MRRRAEVVAIALAALVMLPAARAQHELDAQRETTEAEARAARRDLMRQFAEQVVAEIRMRLGNGIDYPPEALANRWEGTVWLAILYPWGGGPERISVHRSSGHPVLDDKALEMVQAMPLPPRPDALRGVEFDVIFPIGFRLEVKLGG
jgi:protein TonB